MNGFIQANKGRTQAGFAPIYASICFMGSVTPPVVGIILQQGVFCLLTVPSGSVHAPEGDGVVPVIIRLCAFRCIPGRPGRKCSAPSWSSTAAPPAPQTAHSEFIAPSVQAVSQLQVSVSSWGFFRRDRRRLVGVCQTGTLMGMFLPTIIDWSILRMRWHRHDGQHHDHAEQAANQSFFHKTQILPLFPISIRWSGCFGFTEGNCVACATSNIKDIPCRKSGANTAPTYKTP